MRHVSGVLRAGAVLVLATIATACTDAPTSSSDNAVISARDAALLARLGISSADARSVSNGVVVEGDMILTRDGMRRLLASVDSGSSNVNRIKPNLQRKYTTSYVPQLYARSIRVNLASLGATANWADAARAAMAAWSNTAGVGVGMTENSTADIVVRFTSNVIQDCGSTSVIACAQLPSSGRPGGTIYINRAFDSYSVNQKTRILAHEFGHTLGLLHTDGHLYNERWPAQFIRETPQTDASSVMNAFYGGDPWVGFSYYDVRAASILFPGVGFPVSYNQGTSTVTWAPAAGVTSYKIFHYENNYFEEQDGTIGIWYSTIESETSELSYDIARPYTGDIGCGSAVEVVAYLPNGARYSGSVSLPTCGW